MSIREVAFTARIERKQDDLPRYVVVPAARLAPWKLAGTTVVEVALQGKAVARRTVKRWDERRWFLTITQDDCRALSLDTGDEVAVTLRLAADELPAELSALLRAEPRAARAWQALTAAQQRMLAEEIAAAKQPATRTRRALRRLLGERG